MLPISIPNLLGSVEPISSRTLVLIITLVLLALLIQKDISSSIRGARAKRLSQSLDIAIVPLLLMFLVSAIKMIAAVVR